MNKKLVIVFMLMIVVLIFSSHVFADYDDVAKWPPEPPEGYPYVLVFVAPYNQYIEFYYSEKIPDVIYQVNTDGTANMHITGDIDTNKIKLIVWSNPAQQWTEHEVTGGWGSSTYPYAPIYSNYNSAAYATAEIYKPEHGTEYYNEFPDIRVWVASSFDIFDIRTYYFPQSQPGWRQTKSWTNITRTSDGIYEINSDQIPYGYGQNRVEVIANGVVLESVVFNIIKVEDKTAYIAGITDGDSLMDPPTITVVKKAYPDVLTLYVNNKPITRIQEPTKTVYLTSYITQPSLGINTYDLRKDDGTIVDIKTITLLRQPSYPMIPGDSGPGGSGGGGAFPEQTEIEGVIGGAPERTDYADDVWGAVSYGFDTLMYWLKYPFVILGKLVYDTAQDVKETAEELAGISELTKNIFTFLPPQLMALITVLVSITVIFTVIKVIRG